MRKDALKKALHAQHRPLRFFKSVDERIQLLQQFMQSDAIKAKPDDAEITFGDFILYLHQQNQFPELFFSEKNRNTSGELFFQQFSDFEAMRTSLSLFNQKHLSLNQHLPRICRQSDHAVGLASMIDLLNSHDLLTDEIQEKLHLHPAHAYQLAQVLKYLKRAPTRMLTAENVEVLYNHLDHLPNIELLLAQLDLHAHIDQATIDLCCAHPDHAGFLAIAIETIARQHLNLAENLPALFLHIHESRDIMQAILRLENKSLLKQDLLNFIYQCPAHAEQLGKAFCEQRKENPFTPKDYERIVGHPQYAANIAGYTTVFYRAGLYNEHNLANLVKYAAVFNDKGVDYHCAMMLQFCWNKQAIFDAVFSCCDEYNGDLVKTKIAISKYCDHYMSQPSNLLATGQPVSRPRPH